MHTNPPPLPPPPSSEELYLVKCGRVERKRERGERGGGGGGGKERDHCSSCISEAEQSSFKNTHYIILRYSSGLLLFTLLLVKGYKVLEDL